MIKDSLTEEEVIDVIKGLPAFIESGVSIEELKKEIAISNLYVISYN
jgi:hypothetical protein